MYCKLPGSWGLGGADQSPTQAGRSWGVEGREGSAPGHLGKQGRAGGPGCQELRGQDFLTCGSAAKARQCGQGADSGGEG